MIAISWASSILRFAMRSRCFSRMVFCHGKRAQSSHIRTEAGALHCVQKPKYLVDDDARQQVTKNSSGVILHQYEQLVAGDVLDEARI